MSPDLYIWLQQVPKLCSLFLFVVNMYKKETVCGKYVQKGNYGKYVQKGNYGKYVQKGNCLW